MKSKEQFRIAVLIDADNVSSTNIKALLQEVSKYGNPTIKRIYGNWTSPHLGAWKSVLHEHAITPVQQYNYTTGKNSTDSAMIIDAMDILYAEKVEAFSLVSSDSDFTRLATRLREAGMLVIGIGEQKTPRPFIVACDKFIYYEILTAPQLGSVANKTAKQVGSGTKLVSASAAPVLQKVNKEAIQLITSAVIAVADDTGWANLANVGFQLSKIQPDFDPRNFGYNKMGLLVRAISDIEVEERETEKGLKVIYVKSKTKA
jgi:hypothetical protein